MKKMILVLSMVVVILVATAGIAFAGNVEGTAGVAGNWVGGESIHSGYATSTNACKVCHDVHGNANWKLFMANDVASGCQSCHVDGGGGLPVYTNMTGVAHRVDGAAMTVPDSGGAVAFPDGLGCLNCHDAAPHGAGSVAGAYALTKQANHDDFCLKCHTQNDGRVAAGTRASNNTHVMVAKGAAYTDFGATTAAHVDDGATSATCISCHTSKLDFPHTGNFKLLTTGSAVAALDVECRLCHQGVGVNY